MTDRTSPLPTDAQLQQWLERIDGLLHQGFRSTPQRLDDGFAGRDFHVVTLHASQDFWDWPDLELIEETWADLEAALDALAGALAFRWGPPEDVELWPYLKSLVEDGTSVIPQPIRMLSQSASEMRVWRPADHDRFVALSVGQHDKELPIELLAAVGMSASLTPPRIPPAAA
jgi:hypothetical protein